MQVYTPAWCSNYVARIYHQSSIPGTASILPNFASVARSQGRLINRSPRLLFATARIGVCQRTVDGSCLCSIETLTVRALGRKDWVLTSYIHHTIRASIIFFEGSPAMGKSRDAEIWHRLLISKHTSTVSTIHF